MPTGCVKPKPRGRTEFLSHTGNESWLPMHPSSQTGVGRGSAPATRRRIGGPDETDAVIGPVVPVAALLGILLAAGCGSARPTGAGSPSSGMSHAGRLVLVPQAGAQSAMGGAR